MNSKKSAQETTTEAPPVPSIPDADTNGDADHIEKEAPQPKSPLLTSHRLSTASLDNVSLDEEGTPVKPVEAKGMSNNRIYENPKP
jgi:hypothetical protein